MADDSPLDRLDELADEIAEEFAAHRSPTEFKEVSLVIDTENRDHPTLIIHVDHDDAASLADDIEAFLDDRDVNTERETHRPDDVRVLATVE